MKRRTKLKTKIDTDDSKVVSDFFQRKNWKRSQETKWKNNNFWLTLINFYSFQNLPAKFVWRMSISSNFFSTQWNEMKMRLTLETLLDKWWHLHLGVENFPEKSTFFASFCPELKLKRFLEVWVKLLSKPTKMQTFFDFWYSSDLSESMSNVEKKLV